MLTGTARTKVALLVVWLSGALCPWSHALTDLDLEKIRAIVARAERGDPGTIQAAVEALAADLGERYGRLAIVRAIVKAHMEGEFARVVEEFFGTEHTARLEFERWKARGGKIEDAPQRLGRVNEGRALLEACLELRKIGASVAMLGMIGPAFFGKAEDRETAILMARVTCLDPVMERRPAPCGEALKLQLMDRSYVPDWAPVLSRIAVAGLSEIGPSASVECQRAASGLLVFAAGRGFPLPVRVEAVGALRKHWPDRAAEASAVMAKETRTEPEVRELEQLLTGADTIPARCEALLLLGAAGKTAEVRERLETKMRAPGLPEKDRANLDFALRLLRAGEPRAN